MFPLAPTWSVQSCGRQHRLSEGQNQDSTGVTQGSGKSSGRVCKERVVFARSLRIAQATCQSRSPQEANAGGIAENFHFLPLFPLFFTIFYNEEMFGDGQVLIDS